MLFIFVHGLGGNSTEKYWGSVKEFLETEPDIDSASFKFWEYSSSRSLIANFGSTFRRSRKVSGVPEVARDLLSFIEYQHREGGFKNIVLLGHSLGGIIAIHAIALARDKCIQTGVLCVNLLATPQVFRTPLNCAGHILGLNPHLQLILDPIKLEDTFSIKLPELRSNKVFTTYTHYSLDEFLKLDEQYKFDKRYSCSASHSWFTEMNSRDFPPYMMLVDLIHNQLTRCPRV